MEGVTAAAQPAGASAPPAVTPDGVVFTVEAPGAAHVQLAGDFNDWLPDAGEMEPEGGVWKKTLTLAPGRYRYRFVIDGQWQCDPRNTVVEPSPFGGDDSLLVLDPRQSESAPVESHGAA
jgi:5'-AMP-activated protein kinase regulatory beta subunit